MKTYVLTVSRNFPAIHARRGDKTFFVEQILNTIQPDWKHDDEVIKKHGLNVAIMNKKQHTIRGNSEMWDWRMMELQSGKAKLSLRYWSGMPYKSPQIEFATINKDSGIGIQFLSFEKSMFNYPYIVGQQRHLLIDEMAKNDGLSPLDFRRWFETYNLSNTLAIIHFSDKLRY